MGLIDKLKSVFFEEEYVEEVVREEHPKKEKERPPVQIAKKIELPESKKRIDEEEYREEKEEPALVEIKEEQEEVKRENSFKFPMDFEEEDFRQDEPEKRSEPLPYSKDVAKSKEHEENSRPYESYEYRETKKIETVTTFRPSPIISPIYGILDKNYKKEEIITRKEIKLSSVSRKLDLDSVREKAYGDLANEITASILETEDEEEKEQHSNLTYDLNEEDSPAVSKVTVGDAEEYFDDLGLEYNIDYKDSSTKATKATRRSTRMTQVEETEEEIEEDVDADKELEDNLFDLIDSMYEDKE